MMLLRSRVLLGFALLALAVASAWMRADRAFAEACPGSGEAPCPYTAAHIIGQRAEGVLRFPEAVAVDAFGNVYVADQLSYVVQKFTAAGAFEAEWGSFGGGHGQFGPIGGLATDAAGNVYVVDSSHNRIEKFDPNGNFITAWGHGGTELGQFRFFSTQNPSQPPGGGIAVAGNYVYVVDSGNNRIERFNLEGGEAMQWGSYGAGPGQFSYPRGVAASASEVIVTDDNNRRVEKFDPNGNFQGAVGSRGTGPGQFDYPYGVALDAAGNVYVADDSNHRIVKLNPELGFARAWGEFGSKPGQLAFPRALASDPAGDTFVADTANDRIQVFDAGGGYLRTIGASARDLAVLTAPLGLATDPTGRLLVSDTVSNRIELFSPETDAFSGVWSTAVGRHAAFNGTRGIGVDPRGPVYVADPGDERIVRLWGDSTFLTELGGPTFKGGAQLSGAGSVAVAPATGTTYVADANHNRVVVYSPGGSVIAKWGAGEGGGAPGGGQGEFNHPVGVAVDGAGEVYVADTNNNRIVKLSSSGTVLAEWGSRGMSDGRFRSPVGVAVDAAGTVYVLDGGNNRVQAFGSNGGFVEKWGLRGTGLGEFSQPGAISVDCSGDLYVADTNNNRVERFDPVNPAGTGCLAPGTWPPPLDVAPTLHVSLVRHAGVLARHALALAVSCKRGCKILVTATLSPRGGRGAVKLPPVTRGLRPARTERVRLTFGSTTLRRLRRELGRTRAITARVNILAAGPTGRRTTATRTYTVTR
jgi:DNA-binding beta-propeller fold protein YncE